MRGLPEDSLLVGGTDRRLQQWDTQTELLAQVVEVVSVLASDHRFREPRKVPRPPWLEEARRQASVSSPAEIIDFMARSRGRARVRGNR